jgi:hypothetical protein
MIFMGYESNKACENQEKEMTPRGVETSEGEMRWNRFNSDF